MNFIFSIMARPLGLALTALYGVIGNYGITLIVITVIIKLLLYPLYKRQILSTAGMSELQPKMNAIQTKYASDQVVMQQKMQELYKEEGIHPMAGCLPMVIQMFIIMGLFALLRNPLDYVTHTQMYFAVHESFLWIQDLCQPDPWILPIMSGIATFAAAYMSNKLGGMPQMQGGGNSMNLIMQYGMPIMIIWLAKTYAAGLALYWFLSQFIQIFYNIRFGILRKRMKQEAAEKKMKKRVPVRAGEGVRK